MTKQARHAITLAVALTACAGPPARGQPGPPPGSARIRPNIYEVNPAQLPQAPQPGFIEVSGTASVDVPADRAHVSFAMETRADAADQAAAQNADAMDAVLRALRGGGFAGLDLRTFGYSLRPEYAPDNGRTRRIVAYTVLNNVGATVTDIDDVGRLIDVAVAAGANRVVNISFSASDTEPARAEALAAAVRNATAQAEVIADALGYRLGAALEVHGGAQRPIPQVQTFESRMATVAAPTPIEAGDQTVSASVTVRYALGTRLDGR